MAIRLRCIFRVCEVKQPFWGQKNVVWYRLGALRQRIL